MLLTTAAFVAQGTTYVEPANPSTARTSGAEPEGRAAQPMTSLTTPAQAHTVVAAELLDDRYRLTALLHRGDDTETWHAHDARLNRDVTIELIATGVQLQDLLTTRYSDRVPVYDAGSHSWRGGSGTFVVTTDRRDAGPYRPRHSSREPGGPTTSVTMASARLDQNDEPQPLPVGDWQVPARNRRISRPWRGRLRPTGR
jgi:hypothetical protein